MAGEQTFVQCDGRFHLLSGVSLRYSYLFELIDKAFMKKSYNNILFDGILNESRETLLTNKLVNNASTNSY